MFCKLSSHGLIAIKIYGLSSIFDEFLLGLIYGVDGEFISFAYSLAFEGLFIFMKSYQIAFPQWIEAVQDLF